MPDADEPDDVLSHLPSGRPARRSARRAPPSETRSRTRARASEESESPAPARPEAARTPQTAASPPEPRGDDEGVRPVEPPSATEILHSAARAAVDLAGVGVAVGREALRAALSRLPRP